MSVWTLEQLEQQRRTQDKCYLEFLHEPANTEHRFHSISERLKVIVVFAPAEYTRQP
jgi:hypothetical protein